MIGDWKNIIWLCAYVGSLVETGTGVYFTMKNSVSKNKSDTKDLKAKIESDTQDLKAKIESDTQDLKEKIEIVRKEMKEEMSLHKDGIEKMDGFFKKILFQDNGDHNYLSVRAFEKFETAIMLSHKEMTKAVQSIDKKLFAMTEYLELNHNRREGD